MGRSTVYNKNITSEWDQVQDNNKRFVTEYLLYLKSQDRSPQTLHQYEEWLKVFFCWNYSKNSDKLFTNLKKRDFIYYFGWCRELGMSANRIASLKSVLSSLSNEIELLYEDEYPNFRNQVRSLEPIHISTVREKTVLSIEQIKNILEKLVELQEFQLACYIALACASGARKAELIQMKVSDFTKDREVFDGYMYCTSQVRSKGRGKKGKIIKKYVIKELFEPFLNLWLEERQKKGIELDCLFVSMKEKQPVPATISTANTFALNISKICGVDFYAHSARHFFCTYLRSLNLPDEIIVQIFSWADSSLLSVYDDTPGEEKMKEFFKEFIAKQKEVKGE